MNKIKIILLITLLSLFTAVQLQAQGRAFGQLQTMAGSSGYIPPVNPPTPYGEGTYSNNNNNSAAQQAAIIAGYKNSANNYNDKGVRAHNTGDYKKAIAAYKKALWYNPYDETARKNLENARKALKYQRENKNNASAEKMREIEKQRATEKEKELLAQRQRSVEEMARVKAEAARRMEAGRICNEQKNLTPATEAEKANVIKSEADLAEAKLKIIQLQKDNERITSLLKMYSKSLQNNVGEFDTWAKTVDETYKNSMEVAKDYALSHLGGELLERFKPEYRKELYKRFNAVMNSENPAVRKWMLEELADRKLTPQNIEAAMGIVSLYGDGASLLKGTDNEVKQRLDALMFVNSCFETAGWVDYDKLITSDAFLKTVRPKDYYANPLKKDFAKPGDFFTEAKAIGEAYSDIVVQCYSWKTINRLTEDTESMSQKVNLLINKQQVQQEQMNCLQNCINNNDGKCMYNCTGKSKYHTPPPILE